MVQKRIMRVCKFNWNTIIQWQVFDMEFYIYNTADERIGLLQNYHSVQWMKQYQECGEFQIVLPVCDEYVEVMRIGNYIVKSDDKTMGFIQYIKQTETEIEVRGYLDLFKDRSHIDNCRIQSLEDLCDLLRKNQRALNFQIMQKHPKVSCDLLMEPGELSECITSLCKDTGIGYRFLHPYQLEFYRGIENKNGILSEPFGTILEQKYIEDCSNWKNSAIVIGEEWNGVRDQVEVCLGLPKKELYVDASNIKHEYKDGDGIKHVYTDEEYQILLKGKGMDELTAYQITSSFTCEIDTKNTSFCYGKDWNLGDSIHVISQSYGISGDFQVLAVKEIFEDTYTLCAVFGTR